MSSLLVIWTIIAAAGTYNTQGLGRTEYGWRPIGVFVSETYCLEAARKLGLDERTSRCLAGAES